MKTLGLEVVRLIMIKEMTEYFIISDERFLLRVLQDFIQQNSDK